MGATIGIREFKSQTSAVLRKAQRGETITVTDRGKPIVVLGPAGVVPSVQARLEAAIAAGTISGSGGKVRGLTRPPKVHGKSVADAVIEDRRIEDRR